MSGTGEGGYASTARIPVRGRETQSHPRAMTPWETAMEIPSAHGLASDTFAHLCGGPGGYVLSTPEFFLLARGVSLPLWFRVAWPDPKYNHFIPEHEALLLNPFHRFPPEECNAWCIGVLAGDMVAAYRALVAIGGEREFVCWQDRGNVYRWRRTGPKFDALLSTIQSRKIPAIQGPDVAGDASWGSALATADC